MTCGRVTLNGDDIGESVLVRLYFHFRKSIFDSDLIFWHVTAMETLDNGLCLLVLRKLPISTVRLEISINQEEVSSFFFFFLL